MRFGPRRPALPRRVACAMGFAWSIYLLGPIFIATSQWRAGMMLLRDGYWLVSQSSPSKLIASRAVK